MSAFPPHKICIVSHSSYHTRRITLPSYFRWNMTNIGAINITLVYDKITSVVRHFYNKTLVCTFIVVTLHHMNICYDYLPLNSIPLCALYQGYQGCPGYIN